MLNIQPPKTILPFLAPPMQPCQTDLSCILQREGNGNMFPYLWVNLPLANGPAPELLIWHKSKERKGSTRLGGEEGASILVQVTCASTYPVLPPSRPCLLLPHFAPSPSPFPLPYLIWQVNKILGGVAVLLLVAAVLTLTAVHSVGSHFAMADNSTVIIPFAQRPHPV